MGNGDAAIGSAKIDTDDFRHNDCLLYRRNIFINYGMIYSNGRSVGDLHHTEADHPIAHFEALLELLHDLALALFGVFHVHDGVVLVGIEPTASIGVTPSAWSASRNWVIVIFTPFL